MLTLYNSPFDSIFDTIEKQFGLTPTLFNKPNNTSYKYQCMKKAELIDDKLTITYSVTGHDPKNINIETFPDKIHITAKAEENSKFKDYLCDIDETLKLSNDFDGTKANAEIINGLLIITLEKSKVKVNKGKMIPIKT